MKFLRNNQFIRFELFELTFDLLLNLPGAKLEPFFPTKSQKITELLSARFIRLNEPAPPSGYTRSLAKWAHKYG